MPVYGEIRKNTYVVNHQTRIRSYLRESFIDYPAINSGNSGSPVIKGDKLVGVAFQSISGNDDENIGYMVPTPIVDHFLTDIRDGKYDRIPNLEISWQDMENPDIKRKYEKEMSPIKQ